MKITKLATRFNKLQLTNKSMSLQIISDTNNFFIQIFLTSQTSWWKISAQNLYNFMEKEYRVNKAILVGIGVGIAVIVIVGINATLVTQEKPPVTDGLMMGDKAEIEIEKATEETLEPTGGTKYNFTVEESFGLGTP